MTAQYGEPSGEAAKHLNKGKGFYAQGEYLMAITALKKCINEAPSIWEAHYLLGHSYYVRGETMDAIDSYEAALELKQDIQGLQDFLQKIRYEEQTGRHLRAPFGQPLPVEPDRGSVRSPGNHASQFTFRTYLDGPTGATRRGEEHTRPLSLAMGELGPSTSSRSGDSEAEGASWR